MLSKPAIKIKNEGFGFQVHNLKTNERLVLRTVPMVACFVRVTMESNAGKEGINADGSRYTIDRERARWSLGLCIGSDEDVDAIDPATKARQRAQLQLLRDLNVESMGQVYDSAPPEFGALMKGRDKRGFLDCVPLLVDPGKYDASGAPLERREGERVPPCAVYATANVWTRRPEFRGRKKMPDVPQVDVLPSTLENFPEILREVGKYYDYTPIEWINGKEGVWPRPTVVPCAGAAPIPDPSWSPLDPRKRYLVVADLVLSVKPKNGGFKLAIKDNRVTIVRPLKSAVGDVADGLPDGLCTGIVVAPAGAPPAEPTEASRRRERETREEAAEFAAFKRAKLVAAELAAAKAAFESDANGADAAPPPAAPTDLAKDATD